MVSRVSVTYAIKIHFVVQVVSTDFSTEKKNMLCFRKIPLWTRTVHDLFLLLFLFSFICCSSNYFYINYLTEVLVVLSLGLHWESKTFSGLLRSFVLTHPTIKTFTAIGASGQLPGNRSGHLRPSVPRKVQQQTLSSVHDSRAPPRRIARNDWNGKALFKCLV